MAPQNESDKKSGNEKVENVDDGSNGKSAGGSNLESIEQSITPFDDDDPFRSSRIAEVHSQTMSLFNQVQIEPIGLDGATNDEYRDISKHAMERTSWPKARQDAFIGVLRLGRKPPTRAKRIL